MGVYITIRMHTNIPIFTESVLYDFAYIIGPRYSQGFTAIDIQLVKMEVIVPAKLGRTNHLRNYKIS
jgi:hypothetical protein